MRLPPLNALRAFEAAARHEGFATAAEELHVSPGAVSRHVKLLEEHLGVALFRRHPRGLTLTEAGRKLLPEITGSFEKIVEAASSVASGRDALRIATPHTLGPRWLIPRLPRFRERHPEIDVSVGFFGDWGDFLAGNFDAGISCYESNLRMPSGLTSVFVRREALTPVCLPGLLSGSCGPRELAGQTLLHCYPDFADWRKWLEAANATGAVDYQSGQTFESMEMAVQAALGGMGVTIADLFLIRDELQSGQLIAPFDLTVTEDTGYYFFCPRGRLDEQGIVAFREWLLAETESDEARLATEGTGAIGKITAVAR